MLFSDYRGLDVASISELRRKLRETGCEFKVAKNTLAILAFKEAGLDVPAEMMVGPTAITVLNDDLAAPSKVLVDFAKDSDSLTIKGGIMGGQPLDSAAVQALSELPTRDELLAQFIGTLQAPMQQLVTVISVPMRDLVGVFDARVRAEAGAEG